jgi:Na+/H+ antiporter NhaD/arsenite permease-like protein
MAETGLQRGRLLGYAAGAIGIGMSIVTLVSAHLLKGSSFELPLLLAGGAISIAFLHACRTWLNKARSQSGPAAGKASAWLSVAFVIVMVIVIEGSLNTGLL